MSRMKRFCGKERWRRRWESLDRVISGNKTFKKDEYKGLRDALETGVSRRSKTFQAGVEAKYFALDVFASYSIILNKTKRGAYTVFNFIAPYSEGTRQKIADTMSNEQRIWANSEFRQNRVDNFGSVAA